MEPDYNANEFENEENLTGEETSDYISQDTFENPFGDGPIESCEGEIIDEDTAGDIEEETKKSPDEVTFEDVVRAAQKKAEEEEAAREAQAKAEDEARQKLEEERAKDPDLKAAEERADMYQDKYLRTLAEFDNYRNRTTREKAQMYDDGVAATVEKLLPVVDNLERAIQAAADEDDPLLKGVQMTFNQLMETFKNMGVEEIPALGEKFDPAFHAAVAHEENPDYGENEIVLVLQKGYKYKEKVIRPSMVKVAN
ncbi:MAG: nucleotide exchange factor GrpE [Firmicutes bacterium]|nr:nucleotide exchange factor GrpE [Bacillota bacterium]MBR0104247.1 nucleotide exchange factor GrpE [Bacillota bacterium]